MIKLPWNSFKLPILSSFLNNYIKNYNSNFLDILFYFLKYNFLTYKEIFNLVKIEDTIYFNWNTDFKYTNRDIFARLVYNKNYYFNLHYNSFNTKKLKFKYYSKKNYTQCNVKKEIDNKV